MPITRAARRRLEQELPTPCRERTPDNHDVNLDESPSNLEYHGEGEGEGSRDLKWFDKARLRIIAAAVFGFRCLLTLEPGLTNNDLNFIHFLARHTSNGILLALEYAWGLYPGHLNVNSYLNIDILRTDLHHSFDTGVFFFLPTLPVLRSILAFTKRNANPARRRTRDKERFYEVFDETTWVYSLFGHLFDPHRSIHRKNIDKTRRISEITRHPNLDGYTSYTYPFNHPDLQNLASHVHPFFVTANAFMQTQKLKADLRGKLLSEHEALRLVWSIGQVWLRSPPAMFKKTRKGGENAMADPVKDSVSFLAHADLPEGGKYQKNLVYYNHMLAMFDEQRKVSPTFTTTSVFSSLDQGSTRGAKEGPVEKNVPNGIPQRAHPSPQRRRRVVSSEDMESSDWEQVETQPIQRRSTPALSSRISNSESPSKLLKKKVALRNGKATAAAPGMVEKDVTWDFEDHLPDSMCTLISQYPSGLDIESEDGTNMYLSFVLSEVSALKGSRGTSDDTLDQLQASALALHGLGGAQSQAGGAPSSLHGEELPSRAAQDSGSGKMKNVVGKAHPSPSDRRNKLASEDENLLSSPLASTRKRPVVEVCIPTRKFKEKAPGTEISLPKIERLPSREPGQIGKPPGKEVLSSPNASTDSAKFIEAGRDLMLKALAEKFNCDEKLVSDVYNDLGDLEKTERVLVRFQLGMPDGQLGNTDASEVARRTIPIRTSSASEIPTRPNPSSPKRAFQRAQSLGPPRKRARSMLPSHPSTPSPSSRRVFLRSSSSGKGGFRAFNDAESSDDATDVSTSEEEPLCQTGRKSSGLAQATRRPDATNSSRAGVAEPRVAGEGLTNISARSAGTAGQGSNVDHWTRGDRLDIALQCMSALLNK